jgi:hypothetical protein
MAAQRSLFRQEAIDFLHQRRRWGEVVSLQPISSTILSWALAGSVAFMCFLSIAQCARKETQTQNERLTRAAQNFARQCIQIGGSRLIIAWQQYRTTYIQGEHHGRPYSPCRTDR